MAINLIVFHALMKYEIRHDAGPLNCRKKDELEEASECKNQRANRTTIVTHRQLQPCSYIPPRSGMGNSRLFLGLPRNNAAPRKIQYPVRERRESVHDAQSASQYAVSSKDD